MVGVFVSRDHNEGPQTVWLKTTEIDHLAVLEAQGPKPRCPQDPTSCETLHRTLPHLFPASSGGRQSLAFLGLNRISAPAFTGPFPCVFPFTFPLGPNFIFS